MPRRSNGIEFEIHVHEELVARTLCKPDDSAAEAQLNLYEYEIWRWADVPARVLVQIGWHPCHESERRRLYEGPPSARGFQEYGGDWLAIKKYKDGRWHALLGQDKDRRVLSPDDLGTFFVTGALFREFNEKQKWAVGEKQSMVLCYPSDSRITRGGNLHLKRLRGSWGLDMVEFPNFTRSEEWQASWKNTVLRKDDENDEDDEDDEPVPFEPTLTLAVAPTPAASVAPAATSAGSSSMHVYEPKQSLTRLEELTRPDGAGNERSRFQKAAADRMRNKPGVHLLKGPPGIGKTRILSLLMGYLLREKQSTRGASKPHIALFVAPFIDLCNQFINKAGAALELQLGTDWKTKVVKVYTLSLIHI